MKYKLQHRADRLRLIQRGENQYLPLWVLISTSCLVTITGILACSNQRVFAQLLPDSTLGAENSIVNKVNEFKHLINGGAARGANLFHSFQEFNIDTGKSIYFANPVGIENILTRVTGNNISNIFGKLGVEGTANLFLINPNGIIFGQNASLDIRGSFTATTADRIKLGENGLFSATNPQSSNLLTIQSSALFVNALKNQQAEIRNEGNLTVDKNLTLNADNLYLSGEIKAGTYLNLNASNQVLIKNAEIISTNANNFGVIRIGSWQDSVNSVLPVKILIYNSTLSTNNFSSEFAGDIILNASNQIEINNSNISSQGNLGRIFIGKSQYSDEIFSPENVTINHSILSTSNSGIAGTNNESIDAGNIYIDVNKNIFISNNSFIETSTYRKGNAGDIKISTQSLELLNGSFLDASTFGEGNAGIVKITATDNIQF
ncbi:filamentous hemagglutinin N-terminal domain-containing protein, partial [Anabaena cylindrica UHCC 0172]|uniref:filamentous hemagglutinin N-terminal domain-containing protein n=1 Tax=Anabaena cylindrica TaxID=1165 RepID=UPI002B1F668B